MELRGWEIFLERTQSRKVGGAGMGRALDFYGKQAAGAIEDEIHFMVLSRSPEVKTEGTAEVVVPSPQMVKALSLFHL